MVGLIGSFGQKLKQKMNTIAEDAKREKLRAQLKHDIGMIFFSIEHLALNEKYHYNILYYKNR